MTLILAIRESGREQIISTFSREAHTHKKIYTPQDIMEHPANYDILEVY